VTARLEEWLPGCRKTLAQNPAYRPTPTFSIFRRKLHFGPPPEKSRARIVIKY
jgi:hypothetical protein